MGAVARLARSRRTLVRQAPWRRRVRDGGNSPTLAALDQLPGLAPLVLLSPINQEHKVEVHRRNGSIRVDLDMRMFRIELGFRGGHELGEILVTADADGRGRLEYI